MRGKVKMRGEGMYCRQVERPFTLWRDESYCRKVRGEEVRELGVRAEGMIVGGEGVGEVRG